MTFSRPIRIAVCADFMVRPQPTGTQTFMVNLVKQWLLRHPDRVEITLFATAGHDLDRLDGDRKSVV